MSPNRDIFLHFFAFLTVFAVLCWAYDVHHVLFLSPQSQHFWRQTDCTSQALNYYQHGMHFFEPRVHSFAFGDGQTVGEFPILYYLAAIFYHVWGPEEWILRGINLAIYALGLFALMRLTWHLTGNLVIALGTSMMLFASPLLVFYGVNYLPNVPALSLTFVAWLGFFHFYKTQKSSWWLLTNAVFLLAGLLKPTILVTWVAVGAVWLRDVWSKPPKRWAFQKPWKALGGFALLVIPFVAWRLWASQYNAFHGTSKFFLASIVPFWEGSFDQRLYVFQWFFDFWVHSYYNDETNRLFMQLTAAHVALALWHNRLIISLFGMTLLGVVAYVFLFYLQFSVHDYYGIDLFVLPPILLILSALFVKKWLPKALPLVGLAIVTLLIENVLYTRAEIDNRYGPTGAFQTKWSPHALRHFQPPQLRDWLTAAGVPKNDTILAIPDITPNTTLYFYNRRGYTNWTFSLPIPKEYIESLIVNYRCKHLIISDLKSNFCDSLRPYLPRPKAVLDSTVFVYDMYDVLENVEKITAKNAQK